MVTTLFIKLKYRCHILPMQNRLSSSKSQKVGVLDGWNIAFTGKEMVEICFGLRVEGRVDHDFLRIGKGFKPKVFDLISSLLHRKHIGCGHDIWSYDVKYRSPHFLVFRWSSHRKINAAHAHAHLHRHNHRQLLNYEQLRINTNYYLFSPLV